MQLVLQVLTAGDLLHWDNHEIYSDPRHSLQDSYDLKNVSNMLSATLNMPFVHQALYSLTSSPPCHITYLLLPSVAGVIAAFYSSFSVCHIPGSANPLASPLLIVAL